MRDILQLLLVTLALPVGPGSALAQADKEPMYQGQTLSAWIKHLETGSSVYQRASAAVALGKIGPATKEVVPALMKALEDQAPSVRYSALQAIREIDLPPKEAVPAFLKAVQSKDEAVRALAVAGLAEIGPESKEVVPALMKALDDQSYKVRPTAVKALSNMELAVPDAIAFFVKLAERNDQLDAAFAVLTRLGPVNSDVNVLNRASRSQR